MEFDLDFIKKMNRLKKQYKAKQASENQVNCKHIWFIYYSINTNQMPSWKIIVVGS